MTALVELILSLIDLIKAELQQAKKSSIRYVIALLLIGCAAVFFLAGIGLILATLFLAWLEARYDPWMAALLTAIPTLLLAGVLLWLGYRYATK